MRTGTQAVESNKKKTFEENGFSSMKISKYIKASGDRLIEYPNQDEKVRKYEHLSCDRQLYRGRHILNLN